MAEPLRWARGTAFGRSSNRVLRLPFPATLNLHYASGNVLLSHAPGDLTHSPRENDVHAINQTLFRREHAVNKDGGEKFHAFICDMAD